MLQQDFAKHINLGGSRPPEAVEKVIVVPQQRVISECRHCLTR